MAQPGDKISIELDELEMRIRAIVGERDGFPSPAAVARTGGPSDGASRAFESALTRAAGELSLLAGRIAVELRQLEENMAANGTALAEADGSIAEDVRSLEGLIESIPETRAKASPAPAITTDSTAGATTGSTAGLG